MARVAPLCAVLFLFSAASWSAADPGELLKQAIEENKAAPPAKAAEIQRLVSEADKLAEQRKFDQAIGLYERAYRLAPLNQATYYRLLVVKQAAGRLTAAEKRALDLIREQEAASVDQAFRSVRIDILQVREALRVGDADLASLKLKHAEATLKDLPKQTDTAIYQRELGELRKAVVRHANQTDTSGEATPGNSQGKDTVTLADGLDDASTPATQTATANEKSARAADREPEPSFGGKIIDVEALLAESGNLHSYDWAMEQARRRNRTEWFLNNNEASMAPTTDMTFPADWQERTARRARYREGVIYESQPFTGPDGQTYTTVIYDLGDLVHPVPDFPATYTGLAWDQRNEMLDRQYLRERSQIFNGYADDLAAGLPLLQFFGGIDTDAYRPRTDRAETERIIQTIERFVNGK